eukprot:g54992.t1
MPPRKRRKVPLAASSAPLSAAQSLDDDDPPASSSSSASSSLVSQNPHAVQLCKSLLSLPEQLKQLEGGRYVDEKTGSDVFEVNIDRVRGSVEVRQLRENPRDLKTATSEARERVANLIAKRKQDIAGLEKETAVLTTRMERSTDEQEEELSKQLYGIRRMIGKHKDELEELERENMVEVEVERVSTRVENGCYLSAKQIINPSLLLQNGCCLSAKQIINPSLLLQNGCCLSAKQIINPSLLLQNGCCLSAKHNQPILAASEWLLLVGKADNQPILATSEWLLLVDKADNQPILATLGYLSAMNHEPDMVGIFY